MNLLGAVCRATGHKVFYATLAYIRHFTFAGCYDNDPCDPQYLVTNLAGHLEILRGIQMGFIFLIAPLILTACFSSCDGENTSLNILLLPGIEHAPPLTGCGCFTNEPRKLYIIWFFRFFLPTHTHSCFGGFFSIFLAHFLQRSYSKHSNT